MERQSDRILSEWLVVNAQLGEANAMTQLALLWYPRLLRYSARQIGDSEKAKDLVQNTFEIVVRDITKLRDPSAFPSWIYKVIHRQGIDTIRKLQTQRKTLEALSIQTAIDQASDNDSFAKLSFEQSLNSLIPEHYALIHLHYLEGFSIDEISQTLKLPKGTVKSRLYAARQALKPFIEDNSNG